MSDTILRLLQKYDVQGPRYTSYPTVPYWEDAPDEAAWLNHLAAELTASQQAGRGAAIYMHLPYCESLCTFCACNRIITKKHERTADYSAALLAEWAIYRNKLGFNRLPVAELHLGGGTPTFFSPDELQALLAPIIAQMDLVPGAELSFEADPRVTSLEHLKTLYDLGFRRVSLGVQDYDSSVQHAINREQSAELVGRLCVEARAIGYTSINFDLVYGLPKQTAAGIAATVAATIAQKPDRIAFYSYAHVPWVGNTAQRGFDESDLPQAASKREFFADARAAFLAAGYDEIAMDHFALPGDDLAIAAKNGRLFRNFMGYVPRHVSPLIGLGCSAISDAWTGFMQNEKSDTDYQRRVMAGELAIHRGHVLNEEDLIIRQHILNLMTRFETTWPNLPSAIGLQLAEAVTDGLLTIQNGHVCVTAAGRPFIRNICMAFDARLQRKKPDGRIFSKTV